MSRSFANRLSSNTPAQDRACRNARLAAVAAAILSATATHAQAPTPRLELELEAGPAWISRNNAQIPNNESATRFSLNEITGTGPWAAGRVYLTWNANERHSVRALVAPLSITETGTLMQPVNFAGGSYVTSAPVEATYKFNSYRITYRYRLRNSDRTRVWLGATAKIRDANIRLEQGNTATNKKDLGFVPLLHAAAEWRATNGLNLLTDVDALAGGPGRAIDAAVKLGYDPGGRVAYRVGYRTVEGGADVDEVYSFAWIHYAVASIVVRW